MHITIAVVTVNLFLVTLELTKACRWTVIIVHYLCRCNVPLSFSLSVPWPKKNPHSPNYPHLFHIFHFPSFFQSILIIFCAALAYMTYWAVNYSISYNIVVSYYFCHIGQILAHCIYMRDIKLFVYLYISIALFYLNISCTI